MANNEQINTGWFQHFEFETKEEIFYIEGYSIKQGHIKRIILDKYLDNTPKIQYVIVESLCFFSSLFNSEITLTGDKIYRTKKELINSIINK